MAKQNRPGSQKAGSDDTQADKKPQMQPPEQLPNPATNKGKQSGKGRQPAVGGSAVQGARSTQPKELSTSTPSDQQAEYYNRETRRRMQHMGTGPYKERTVIDPRERRRKRQERLKERQERVRHIVNVRGPSRNVKLGRRNTYFLISIISLIIILIVVFIIIRHPF